MGASPTQQLGELAAGAAPVSSEDSL